MAQHAGFRASDEDREKVADRLRHAAAEGRLLASELEDRLATALRAKTYGELDAVVADLPGGRVASGSRQAGPRKRARARSYELARAHPVPALVLAATVGVVVVAVVLALMIAFVAIWTVWVIVGWALMGRGFRPYPYRQMVGRGGPAGRMVHPGTRSGYRI